MNDNPHIPFTFVQVDESMYNMTLERIKKLNEENEQLRSDVEALETLVSNLDDDLSKSETDKLILTREIKSWRKWFDTEAKVPVTELLLWQKVVNARQLTDNHGCLDRTENQS